ncbi:MAG: nitroreductase family protein [Comamonadaceae bacterium]|nr:nitroreductase family protein [Comamonadaceae bacterium]
MFEYDVGAAMENMILAALAEGVGACWLLSIDREKLKGVLGVPDGYRIDSVLALGYPAEEPAAEVMGEACTLLEGRSSAAFTSPSAPWRTSSTGTGSNRGQTPASPIYSVI